MEEMCPPVQLNCRLDAKWILAGPYTQVTEFRVFPGSNINFPMYLDVGVVVHLWTVMWYLGHFPMMRPCEYWMMTRATN